MTKWILPLILSVASLACNFIVNHFVEINCPEGVVGFGLLGVLLITIASVKAMEISNQKGKE